MKGNAMAKKRVGRPPVEGPKRDRILRFVVTTDEGRKIRAKAKSLGLSLSDYLRSVAIPRD
jgi:hypothetical protein